MLLCYRYKDKYRSLLALVAAGKASEFHQAMKAQKVDRTTRLREHTRVRNGRTLTGLLVVVWILGSRSKFLQNRFYRIF